MLWWIWLVAGLALMLGELLTPGGFYLLVFRHRSQRHRPRGGARPR